MTALQHSPTGTESPTAPLPKISASTRQSRPRVAGAKLPPPQRCAPVWQGRIDRPEFTGDHPLVWLLGATGGAGVTALCASMPLAGDCNRAWPDASPETGDSPCTVIVTRTTASGLARAHDLVVQWCAGGTSPHTQLLGVISVADSDRPLNPETRAALELVESAVSYHWRVGWIEPWRFMLPEELPSFTPGSEMPTGRRAFKDLAAVPPRQVVDLQADLLEAAKHTLSGKDSI